MKVRGMVFALLCFFSEAQAAHVSIPSKVMDDISDTLATGIPLALFSGVWWAVANRIPRKWPNLSEPAATFIRATWQEQGLKRPEKIMLKVIPRDSFLSKIIMYTQELPHALAVGPPFKEKIETLLYEKVRLEGAYAAEDNPEKKDDLRKQLTVVEEGLAECRFVCGHERVHKERYHTYKMLLIQFIAPFIFHSILKHSANALDRHELWPAVSFLLRKNSTRSLLEMITFWITAHLFEREADLHASHDPEEINAGIRLFVRAQALKASAAQKQGLKTVVLLWFLKYTHPTTPERLSYLRKALKRAYRLQHSVTGKSKAYRRNV